MSCLPDSYTKNISACFVHLSETFKINLIYLNRGTTYRPYSDGDQNVQNRFIYYLALKNYIDCFSHLL